METAYLRARKQPLSRKPIHSANGHYLDDLNAKSWRGAVGDSSRLSLYSWLLVAGYIAAIYHVVLHFDAKLPSPLSRDTVMDPDKVFLESSARECLLEITSFGPRISGSESNEVHAKEMLLRRIEDIRRDSEPVHTIETDVQKPSGCFWMHFFTPFTSCYREVTNVVARIRPAVLEARDSERHAVLLNCHFDSVPDSPGASDDAVSCCVMLDILRVLSRLKVPLRHDVIFLFNGAEENFLQASHGFITQHPWRHNIRTFINIEACGAGGRELLFQAGPGNPWLVKTYITHAPHPHTSVMAQEVFQAGLVPSDTDFRIFRDYGRIPGLDLAFIKNGYIYHTEFDQEKYIHQGSIQRAGENVLAMVKSLANSTFLSHPWDYEHLQQRIVFFDVLGLFGVHYPHWLGRMINMGTVALVVMKVLYALSSLNRGGPPTYSALDLALASVVNVVAVLVGGLFIAGITQIVTVCNLVMAWYSRQVFVVLLYILPGAAGGYAVHVAAKRFYLKRDFWLVEQLYFDSNLLINSAILLYFTYKDLGSAYFMLTFTAFPLVVRTILCWIYRGIIGAVINRYVFLLVHLLAVFVPCLFGCLGMLEITTVFLPIMGRAGSNVNPEYIVGAICLLAVSSILTFTGSLIYISRDSKHLVYFLLSITSLTILVSVLSDYSIPYNFNADVPRLRRMHLQHASRKTYDMDNQLTYKDQGIWIVPLDYRGAADLPSYSFSSSSRPVEDSCSVNDTFCGLPYYIPLRQMFHDDTRWMDTPAGPKISKKLSVVVTKKDVSTDGDTRLAKIHVNITGPDHITSFITPRNGWDLFRWSFTDDMPWPKQESYFVYLSYTKDLGPWEFWLWLKHAKDADYDASKPVVTLTAVSHILHGPENKSEPLMNVVKLTAERREKAKSAFSWWRWQNVIQCWTSEVETHDF